MIKYTEKISWILDKPKSIFDKRDDDLEEKIKANIDFVHSLGLKCDCVGWSHLNLADERTPEIFREISEFCRKNGFKARALYEREYTDLETDWYEIDPAFFKDDTTDDRIETLSDDGEKVFLPIVKAYRELTPAPKRDCNRIAVPERFRDFCLQNDIDAFDFCWLKDKGKYAAEQYFMAYGKREIPQIGVDFGLDSAGKATINAVGGWLPEVKKTFHTMQMISLPDCYLKDDMPEEGIAYAYLPSTWDSRWIHSILVRKDVAKRLIEAKIVPSSILKPAPVFDELPAGYSLKRTSPIPRPTASVREKMLAECEKLKASSRPEYAIPEKEALKLLRAAKRERKEEFKTAMRKAVAESLKDTAYGPIAPYYAVADGGFLSDEYEFLSHANALAENIELQSALEAEETLESKPTGIVIAKCPDGDLIILCDSGRVVRFSHESPEIVDEWSTLPMFFVDALNS